MALLLSACSTGVTASEAGPTTQAAAPTVLLTTTSTMAQATTDALPAETEVLRSVVAPVASIVVDGNLSEWDTVPEVALSLEAIVDVDDVETLQGTIQVAHDHENIYLLFTVTDDYNFDPDDHNLSAAMAVMFAVDPGAGAHMGTGDEEGEGPSLGLVDMWHWELDCAAGIVAGGTTDPGFEGADPGNDMACNLDDEWATDPETAHDDASASGENSLAGVWGHSNQVEDGPGVWFFEIGRPLQTGDSEDVQLTVGETALLALAFWDPDVGPDGWDDDTHVQSSNQGWIEIMLQERSE